MLFVVARHRFVLLTLASFLGIVLLVNPLRNMVVDDDWAYASMVDHLNQTGQYKLDDWAAANMPFQIYWGAAFTRLGGNALSMLRVSTLVLAFLGLIALYLLALEHGLSHDAAGLATLVALANPLALRLSFTFMTDVPFMSCLVISLLLYTRAVKRRSMATMMAGALAACAAILTRQFGVALIAGLGLLWLTDRGRKRLAALYLAGLVLPVAAGGWQILAGFVAPNWGAAYVKDLQYQYWTDVPGFLREVLWRPAIILQYLALFVAPLSALAIVDLLVRSRAQGGVTTVPTRTAVAILTALTLFMIAAVGYVHYGLERQWYMPYLPWNFDDLHRLGNGARVLLTIFTAMGGIVLGRIVLLRYVRSSETRPSRSEALLDVTALVLLLETLLFYKIGDEYLLVFAPYTIIVASRHLQPWRERTCVALVGACLVLAVAAALWTRGNLERIEASWKAADVARLQGIDPERIYGDWAWMGYHDRTFDKYLKSTGYRTAPGLDGFGQWLRAKEKSADFVVRWAPSVAAGEATVATVPYRGILLRETRLHLVQRPPRVE